jgi:hypothetical protein
MMTAQMSGLKKYNLYYVRAEKDITVSNYYSAYHFQDQKRFLKMTRRKWGAKVCLQTYLLSQET